MQQSKDLSAQQEMLNTETLKLFFEKGGMNDVQARYIYQTCLYATVDDNPVLTPLQPRVKNMDNPLWTKAMCFCIAYLRRYKMNNTIRAIKCECDNLPKSTGFGKVSELEMFWRSLLKSSVHLGDKTFDECVIEYKEAMDELQRQQANKSQKLEDPQLDD
ncbi:hypothetical protein TVAG_171790 [Trichomonas vaginalis G3]|uniref:Uncharacterized protein n=1 Tax=Trichomonas vaginalis (strain ATCC PRA-98 / G3) TaxID=412133 RepID=A2EWA4_TRIV3|nr:hypothetical protein TVAGG3_0916110 [Trichomonas vaginalis G3]EAY03081.1 hypothetical protein TVAG_171790 [Trichomonas vaginalis G3]KAI5484806.1 hypothetical protein TVAGG3_0916110 [Trichomonas vaginalis G3]|eukprot:XP_001315304.1 hypothetical protein [Trichomonas vaginalis G3]